MEHRGGVWIGLAFGGFSSCVAEVITIPIDVIKTRMQVVTGTRPLTAMECGRALLRESGPKGFFRGLSPALLRQSTYGSLRYGLYTPVKEVLTDRLRIQEGLALRVLSGSLAGCLSSVLANPCDLIKVRMQTAGQPSGLARAFVDIVQKEGVLSLWKGVGPTAGRATVLAAVELSSYDTIRRLLVQSERVPSGFPLHLSTALLTGFLATFASSPFDVVKSRVMGQPIDPITGKGLYYRGMTHCFVKTVQTDGFSSLWRGFVPNYCRVGPRVAIVFVVMEQLRELFQF